MKSKKLLAGAFLAAVAVVAGLAPIAASGTAVTACNPQQAATAVNAVNVAKCVLGTYFTDIAQGKSEADALIDTAATCGLSVAEATGVLDAHRAAEVKEAEIKAAKAADGGR